jgi:hypothetical protein
MVTCHTTIANMTPTTCDQSRDHTTSTTSTTCDQSHDHRNHVISHTTSTTCNQSHDHTTTRPSQSCDQSRDHATTPSVTRPCNHRNQSRDHAIIAISHATTRHPRPPLIYSGSFTKLFSSNGPHSPLIHFITTFFILQHITYERNSSIYSLHYY